MPLNAKRYLKIIECLASVHCNNILEIGVWRGDTAIEMLKFSRNKKVNYYGVDLFDSEGVSEEFIRLSGSPPYSKVVVEATLKSQSPNVTLFQGFSKDLVTQIQALNVQFDLIFIDGDHSYEAVKEDFELYNNLLSKDGIIFFDDYTEEPGCNRGVKKFIDELQSDPKYTIIVESADRCVDNYRGYKYQIASLVINNSPEKQLHICSCLTDSLKNVYNGMFLPTLADNCKEFDHIDLLQILDRGEAQPGDTGNRKFMAVVYQKLHYIYSQIKAHLGDNLIYLDVDIVFFGPFKSEINKLLERYEMVLQDNDNWLNAGVFAMRCDEAVLKVFENYILPLSENILKEHGSATHDLFGEPAPYYGDQEVINIAIRDSGISAGKLPITYYSNHLKDHSFPSYVPPGCVLFHATNCGTGEFNKGIMLKTAYDGIMRRR